MGFNINWSNKNEKDIKIAETRARVEMNESNNRASVDKHVNTTNLIGIIAKGVLALVGGVLGASDEEK